MRDRSALLRATATGALDLVRRHRPTLDALNIFPVADSDTGTNVCLTFAEAVAAAADLDPPTTQGTAAALARGALLGARGNSGVILGQYLGELVVRLAGPAGRDDARGASPPPPGAVVPEPGELAAALVAAAAAARAAVARPVEGTVLTVADDVGRAASASAAAGGSAVVVLDTAVAEARRAVVRTTGQLDALAAAGVQDAGGWALVLLLEALRAAVGGTGTDDVLGPPRRGTRADAGADASGCVVVAPDTSQDVPAPAHAAYARRRYARRRWGRGVRAHGHRPHR